jgi:tetratricopeptide (TPR) repeat protein
VGAALGESGKSVEPRPVDAQHFAAFISYSHVDTNAAAKLQRRLERYRLPKAIAQTRAAPSQNLGVIFRDREDLAAASNLSVAIHAAISRAEALVVICSPDAAASPWVAAEIELFRELHPDRPILAALLSGEPSASFPTALTAGGLEPLAADLRPEGDGEQLGFLKIVAGIAGVPLDALIQRDAQRRIRRVTAITAGALAAMLVMGIMTTLALQARNEAALQRAASDGLVEYMLTDLREKLRSVGRGEIMIAVNRRALQHYAGQGDLSQLPAESLEHRARVLHAMGEDAAMDSKPDIALARFREAHSSTAALLQRDPDNPDRIFAHAQSEYYIGMAAMQKIDYRVTARHFRGYLQQAQALARIEPGSFRSHMELGYGHGNLCELALREMRNLAAAEQHCRKAIMHEQRALAAKPGDAKTQQDIANRWGWLARVQTRRSDWDGAIASRGEEARLMDALIANEPNNVEYAVRRTWATAGLAAALVGKGDLTQAQSILRNAIPKFDRATMQVTGDYRVAETRIRMLALLAKAERQLGSVSSDTQKRAEAMFKGRNAQEIRRVYIAVLEEGA